MPNKQGGTVQGGTVQGGTVQGGTVQGGVEMLTPVSSGGSVASQANVTSGISINKWFGVAALLAVALVGWSLMPGSSSPAAGPAEVRPPADQLAGGIDAADTDPSPELNDVLSPEEKKDTTTEDTVLLEVTEPLSTTSGEIDSPKPVEEKPEFMLLTEDGKPASSVLEEPIGFAVLVSGGGRTMSLVDLDQPRSVEVEGPGGEMVLATETHLILMSDSGVLYSMALDDLRGEPVRIRGLGDWPSASEGPESHQAWLMDSGSGDTDSSLTRTLVDLSTGENVRSYSIEGPLLPIGSGAADLANVLGNGVFQETSEGQFVRFSDGWALAASDDLVLIQICSDDLTCGSRWLDRTTGEELDYPRPKLRVRNWWGSGIDSTSRWLWTAVQEQFELFEIRTGRVITLDNVDPWPGPSISPDGRWVTFSDHQSGQLKVIDLETEEIYHIEHHFFGGRATFVPLEFFPAESVDQ